MDFSCIKYLKTCSILSLGLMALASCTSDKPVAEGKALFSHFVYEGHDSAYDQEPLATDAQAYNPILPGWHSDPSVCADGKGNYYLVASTFGLYPGVSLHHSRDLLNWRQCRSILTRPQQLPLDGQNIGKEGIYAASMFFNPANATYYMITTNMGRMTHEFKPGTFVVKTTDPEGEWSDPLYLENMGGIDPSMFFDNDGKAYVIYCRMHNTDYPGHNSIIMQEYDLDADTVITSTAKVIADKGAKPKENPMCLEGPHLYKVNGKYYLLCAEGGTELGHSEVVFRSDNVWGPYEAWSKNPILTQRDLGQRDNGAYCTGHADIFQDGEGQWWSVFLGTRMIDGAYENLGRETFLLPVRWTTDGWPLILEKGESVPMIVEVPGAVRGERPTFGNFTIADDFEGPELANYWMTVRSDAKDKYSLTENPGYLTLVSDTVTASDLNGVPAFVGRKLQHHSFDASVKLNFNPRDTQKAGLLLLKSEDHQYFFAMGNEEGHKALQVIKIGQNGSPEILASTPVEKTEVQLKVSSADGRTFDFAYSLADGPWTPVASGIPAAYLATDVFGTASSYTGTLIGPYAVAAL